MSIGFANVPTEAADQLHAYLLLNEDDTGFAMTLVLSDGRAYDRHIDSAPGGSERVIANDVASLLRAAAQGTTKADREGVEVAPLEEDPATTEPPEEEPPEEETPPPEEMPEEEVPPPGPEPAKWLLGARISGGAGLGLSADPLGTSWTGGGSLAADFAWASGPVVSLSFNPAVHGGELTWARFGIGVGGGYLWRRDSFELLSLGYLVLEPNFIADSPDLQREDTDSPGPPPLWGGRVSLGPGVRLGRDKALRLGARLDLSYLVAADQGVGAPRIFRINEDGTRDLVARAGGAELGLGLDFQWWFSLRPSTRTRP